MATYPGTKVYSSLTKEDTCIQCREEHDVVTSLSPRSYALFYLILMYISIKLIISFQIFKVSDNTYNTNLSTNCLVEEKFCARDNIVKPFQENVWKPSPEKLYLQTFTRKIL